MQQTPKPDAQAPAFTPFLFEHSSLKNGKIGKTSVTPLGDSLFNVQLQGIYIVKDVFFLNILKFHNM